MSTSIKPEEWGERFAAARPTYMAYTRLLEALLVQLLDQASISYVQIEGRTKEISNFVSKLRRKGEKYADPLVEVTDLTGLRVVLYYSDDIDQVGEIIGQQFEVDTENSINKADLLDPDRFGYLSVHHVVRLQDPRKSLPEWSPFAGLAAEIQVRTVLQHAWGAISRKLAYANVREAPRDLQRSLNRLSALLELADDEFLDIRRAREEIEKLYDRELERGNLDLEIDESSLEVYLREAGVSERIAELAREAGSPPEETKKANFDEEAVEEMRQEKARQLLVVLEELGITSIAELDRRLSELWREMPAFMKTVNENYVDDDEEPISAFPLNWLVLILLWSEQAPAEKFTKVDYVDDLIGVVISTYDTLPPGNS